MKGILCFDKISSVSEVKDLRIVDWKWQPTPVFLPREFQGAWQSTVHGVTRVRHNLVTKQSTTNASFF